MKGNGTAGHLSALLTIIIWGTTFISTKVLLASFQPVEILFFRFVMGLLALLVVYPRRLKGTNRQQELTFAAAGLCGICLYYLLENIALTYTMASNVGVIISAAPFFTAILSHLFLKEEKPYANFFIGFVVAMTGIALISFNGSKLELNCQRRYEIVRKRRRNFVVFRRQGGDKIKRFLAQKECSQFAASGA